ncbi:MAG: hypothetical protein M3043_14630, partial [Lysinibacillus fusiformis]|nr:hypothetical protein [Lysinibacillus fusiformis]
GTTVVVDNQAGYTYALTASSAPAVIAADGKVVAAGTATLTYTVTHTVSGKTAVKTVAVTVAP